MQWTESEEDGVQILRLKGEVDLMHSPALRKLLRQRLEAQCSVVIVDFTGVEYIDSSGLAVLIEYCRDARSHGGSLAVVGLNDRVRTIFDLVRAHELFSIFDTVEEARNAPGGKNEARTP